MNWIENILIIGGISLDVFAAMEIEGSLLAEVKKKSLFMACFLVTILQLGFFFGGYFICSTLHTMGYPSNAEYVGEIIAICIFAFLGIRLVIKAIRREFVNEQCREISVKKYIKIIVITSIYTLLAGCACGFVGSSWVFMFFVIIICSILVVVGGLYTGYHFGFQAKTVAYFVGALLLLVAGVEILVKDILMIVT